MVLELLIGLRIIFGLVAHVLVGFAQKATRTACAVIKGFAHLRVEEANHRADQGARRVVLAAIASRIAHFAQTRFVEHREFVAVGFGLELERLHQGDDFAQEETVGKTAIELFKDGADALLNRIGCRSALFEFAKPREKGVLDKEN